MNLLGAKLYDPAVAVSKSTAALLAMTAFDTTNLRVAVTIPAHGMIYVRIMGGAVTGATTVPTILLGVMNGATVLARVSPQDFPGTMNATTQSCPLFADFVITGLTPGAMNLDLAYGVEVVVAATNIKYGGPNDTTTNNAWGGISFQVWDPQPQATAGQLVVDANGRVDVSKVLGTAQTAGDIIARLPAALVSGRMDASVGAMAANVLTAAAINAAALNGKGDWNIGKTGYALAAAEYTALVNAIWDELTSEGRTVGSYGQLLKDDLNATVSSRASAIALTAVDVDVLTRAAPGDAMALVGAVNLTPAAVDAILDDPVEGALTLRQLVRIIVAALAGKADGFPAGPVHYRDQLDTKNRITATVDANGNRTAVTVDAS